MEKTVWLKIVWLGVVLAIPAAIFAVQKPEAPRSAAPPRHVVGLDPPVVIDISDRQIEFVKPPEPVASASEEAQKPRAMYLGAEKITSKVAPSNPAPGKTEPLVKDQNLASALAPVPGPSQ